jgi:hypothetical protein
LDAECEQIKVDIQDNREQLTQNRQAFLETVLQGNDDISIQVLPYKEGKKSLEKKVRQILQCGDKKYSKDIDNLMLMKSYQGLKDKVEEIYRNKALAKDQRFHQHLYDLPPVLYFLSPHCKICRTLFSSDFLPSLYGNT